MTLKCSLQTIYLPFTLSCWKDSLYSSAHGPRCSNQDATSSGVQWDTGLLINKSCCSTTPLLQWYTSTITWRHRHEQAGWNLRNEINRTDLVHRTAVPHRPQSTTTLNIIGGFMDGIPGHVWAVQALSAAGLELLCLFSSEACRLYSTVCCFGYNYSIATWRSRSSKCVVICFLIYNSLMLNCSLHS